MECDVFCSRTSSLLSQSPLSLEAERAHLEAERLAGHAVVYRQEVLERQLVELGRADLEHGLTGTAPRLSTNGYARDADSMTR